MKPGGFLILTLLSLNAFGQMYSQGENRLPKEEIRRIWDGTEYVKEGRILYGYDANGRMLSSTYQLVNESGLWVNQDTWRARYDGRGNQTYIQRKVWDNRSLKLRYETETHQIFIDSLMIESTSVHKDYFDEVERISTWKKEYDDHGIIKMSQSIENRNGEISGYRSRYYREGPNCPIAMASFMLRDDSWNITDSTVYHDCDYNSSITKYTFQRGVPEVVLETKAIFDYDSAGNETELRYYRNNSQGEWLPESAIQHIRETGTNRLLSYYYLFYQDSILRIGSLTYSGAGTDSYTEREEMYTWPDSILIQTSTSAYAFDSVANIRSDESEVYSFALNKTLSKYERYSYYDDNLYLVRRESYSMFDEYQVGYTESLINDCDGAVLQAETEWYGSGESENKRRTEYCYYQNAECAETKSNISQISVFPNPATDYISVYAPENFGRIQVQVVGSSGMIHQNYETEVSNFFYLDTSSLKPGAYTVSLSKGDTRYSKQFIISY